MFKNKNRITRISNAVLVTLCALSLMSVVSLITTDYTGVEGYTKEIHLYNLVIMLCCSIVTGVMMYILNKKIDPYKEEYTLSRKLFNLFIVFSIISMSMMFAMPIAEYFINGDFYLYNLLYLFLGYIPAYLAGYVLVNKKEMLSDKNSKKINITNFLVIYLLMSYYINIITDLIQLLYKLQDSKTLLIDIGLSVAWILIVFAAFRMINKDATVENREVIKTKSIEPNKEVKDAKIVEEKPKTTSKKKTTTKKGKTIKKTTKK